jgi:hypothetical protein
MNNGIMRFRFNERDDLFYKIQSNSQHITIEQINSILDKIDFVDLTFIYTPHKQGYHTEVWDNLTEKSIHLDDLSITAWDYYIHKLTELCKKRAENDLSIAEREIQKIRMILDKTNKKGELMSDRRI